jgi:Fe-S cluster biogenesis protein NfuA
MFIQTEDTPNPNVVKFLPETKVLGDIKIGKANFTKGESCNESPLVSVLLDVDGVSGIYLGADFISITKQSDYDWMLLKPVIFAEIADYCNSGKDIYLSASDSIVVNNFSNEIEKEIYTIIETKVRPSVALDGGDIRFKGFVDGIVYLKMEGACAGCPSSTITLKNGIENMLKHYVPEVLEVRQVEDEF